MEYSFTQKNLSQESYKALFESFSQARSTLGSGKKLTLKTPTNPLLGHQAMQISTGVAFDDGLATALAGVQVGYHSAEDGSYGFLRGTEIDFLSFVLAYKEQHVSIQEATLFSVASFAQRSHLFKSISWRGKVGWDKESLSQRANFISTAGAGVSWGNKSAYMYMMLDPLVYYDAKVLTALGGSIGLVYDGFAKTNTNLELTKRYYDTGEEQWLIKASQNFRVSQNLHLLLKYDSIEKNTPLETHKKESYKALLHFFL